jgi:hypothetical protein
MLLFLKGYSTEAYNRTLLGADEKTIRKWVWAWVQAVADLDVVSNTNILETQVIIVCVL